jgi:hypothetical protein
MSVELPEMVAPDQAEVTIEVRVKAQINVTAQTAQRKVSKLLLDEVGNLLHGEKPNLVAGDKLLWRVPVWLSMPSVGPVGRIGHLDVNAQTGEINFAQQELEELAARGNALAERTASTTR